METRRKKRSSQRQYKERLRKKYVWPRYEATSTKAARSQEKKETNRKEEEQRKKETLRRKRKENRTWEEETKGWSKKRTEKEKKAARRDTESNDISSQAVRSRELCRQRSIHLLTHHIRFPQRHIATLYLLTLHLLFQLQDQQGSERSCHWKSNKWK